MYVCGKFLAVRGFQPAWSEFGFKIRKGTSWDDEVLGTSWGSCPINYVIPLDGGNDIIYKDLDPEQKYDIYTNFSKVQLVANGSDIPTSLN